MQSLPIPVVKVNCKHKCCQRTYLPLTLSFARSIHKFQGLQAGPTSQDQPSNMYTSLIVDPGTRSREGTCPGLLYTAVSRATTLGDESGLGSALYFRENTIDEDRLTNITIKPNTADAKYKNVNKRDNWLLHAKEGTEERSRNMLTTAQLKEVLAWADVKRVQLHELDDHIEMYRLFLNEQNQ